MSSLEGISHSAWTLLFRRARNGRPAFRKPDFERNPGGANLVIRQPQLNTAYRPPCEKYVQPMTNEELQKAAAYFSCPIELIRAENAPQSSDDTEIANDNDIVTMVGRRPCTIDDISAGLEMNRLEVVKCVERLIRKNAIVEMRLEGRVYFSKSTG
jgi:hypothetical protein